MSNSAYDHAQAVIRLHNKIKDRDSTAGELESKTILEVDSNGEKANDDHERLIDVANALDIDLEELVEEINESLRERLSQRVTELRAQYKELTNEEWDG